MTTDVLQPDGPLAAQLVARARDPEQYALFEAQLRSSGYCHRPVRLRGFVETCDGHGGTQRVYSTAREPDGVLRKACGNRREAVCPTCAERYRGDAYHLIAAGLRGGKGIPDSVAGHPAVFVTLTAPSFGPVHTHYADNRRRCRPRRDAETCPHGVRLSCARTHAPEDPQVGEPICPDCFDYQAALIWNNRLGELWRRTTIYIPRALARLLGITQKELKRRVRVSYVKVGEYQRRGLLHVHVAIRLDRAQPAYRAHDIRPPGARYTTTLLADAVRVAVADVSCPVAENVPGTIRWGAETEIQPIATHDAGRRAGYLAKYATKSTEQAGGVHHRIDPGQSATFPAREHPRRYALRAFELSGDPDLRGLRLARYAHTFGARAHCLTKSRRYSTTFTALRAERERHVHQQLLKRPADDSQRTLAEHAETRRSTFHYAGIGHFTAADELLAHSGAAKARQHRQAAREGPRAWRWRRHDVPGAHAGRR